ncbi:hypothetical protein [Armatimonas sp.]|uniref:OB-fold protein n=1 Tax=Armatimonas sp. TaxID=1872638 RepID=UPI00374D1B56
MKELRKKLRLDILSFLTGVLVSCSLGVVFYFWQASQPEQPLVSQNTEATVHVVSTLMRLDYEKNLETANEKYKGKVVHLGGELASVNVESAEHSYMLLSNRVKCYFDGPQESLGRIPKETYVTLKGICAGNIHGNIVMEHCILLSPADY